MKDHILNTFKKATLEMEHDGIISVIDTEHKYALRLDGEAHPRIPILTLIVHQTTLDEIGNSFHLGYHGYGEIPLLMLFNYIIENDNDHWLLDIDVMNWNIMVGAFRDLDEARDTVGDHGFGSLDSIYGEPGDMYFILEVELRDYMS